MPQLALSIAVGDYDRMRPLIDRRVPIDGVDPTFLTLEPEEIFFRAIRHAEFDVCELSLSSFTVKTALGENPYVGVPVFPSRCSRHTSILVRKDRGIRSPADLKGKRIGTPEWQLTANVWARALLNDEYGVHQRDIIWVRGGIEDPGRAEKVALNLPADLRIDDAPPDRSLNQMLAAGEIDGFVGPRFPSCYGTGDGDVRWLFENAEVDASAWYEKTKIFPIMHLLGVRKTIVEAHPWLPATLLKGFTQSKRMALASLSDVAATKVTLPFVEEQLARARKLMGEDFWSYGFAANRHVIETFARHHYAQGVSSRLVAPEELFHPSTLETAKV